MADPLTIIGAAASVVQIVEVLAKTLSRLSELNERWKQAEYTFINLIAQLSALKAALNKLQEWMDTDIDETHHQLVMDLELSIKCCRMLIDKMDSEVSELSRSADSGLNSQGKIKLMIKNGKLEELQKMVERQTNALTLLLTVCNCKAISEQKKLLEKPSARKVFQRIQDDSSSLYGQRDSTSLSSWRTGNLSRISKLFEFDRELFVTKVYEKALQSSLKDTVENLRRPSTPRLRVESTPQEVKRTAIIDQRLEEDSKKRRRECKVLVLGDPNCTQTFMNQMRISHMRGFTDDERVSYQATVRNNVVDIVKALASIIANDEVKLDQTAKIHATLLSRELTEWETGPKTITVEVANAVQGLWTNEQLKSVLFDSNDVYTSNSAPYFIKEIHRVAEKNYIPTETDILMARTRASGIQEYKFDMGSLGVHMFSIGGQRLDRKKFIHQFENITSIVFSVDLSGYDQVLPDGSNQNQIIESLQAFDSVVNSRWFLRTSVILLLCNMGLFKRKLARSPMGRQFPDYTGGSDVAQASKYIFWRFNQLNRMDLSLFPHLCEASDTSNIRFVFAAIKDTIIFNAMKDSGIPVERKNSAASAASAASSSRKGSNDTIIEKGAGVKDKVGGKEEKEQVLEGDTLQGEKDGEDNVREEWEENIGNQGAQNNNMGEYGAGAECWNEPTPSEIGVAL